MSTFKVVTDSEYTGGLSWLITNFDVVVEPTGEYEEVDGKNNEIYTVEFTTVDGADLLDDCDAVISYEQLA